MKTLIVILTATLLGLASCADPKKITFPGPVEYEVATMSRLQISAQVMNCTAYNIKVLSGRFRLHYATGDYATVMLGEEVTLPKCSASRVEFTLRMRFADPLMALSAATMETIPLDKLYVSGEAVVRAGMGRKKIRVENQPLSRIIGIFGEY